MSDDAKCVCGHRLDEHSGLGSCQHLAIAGGGASQLSRFCPCPEFRPAEEAKTEPAPENVYERATRALSLIGWQGTRDEHDAVICEALNAGEAAEKRVADLEEQLRLLRITDPGYRERAEAAERRVSDACRRHELAMGRADAAEARVKEFEGLRDRAMAAYLKDLDARDARIKELEELNENDARVGACNVRKLRDQYIERNDAIALLKPARPEDGLLPAIRDVMQQLVSEREAGKSARDALDKKATG